MKSSRNDCLRIIVSIGFAVMWTITQAANAMGYFNPSSLQPTGAPAVTSPASRAYELVYKQYELSELLARKAREQSSVWADGEELTMFFQGAADEVTMSLLNEKMQHIPDTEAWALTLRIPKLSQGVITCYARIRKDGQEQWALMGVWRGPDAPLEPIKSATLHGTLQSCTFKSQALGESRKITLYTSQTWDKRHAGPVIYMADGQDAEIFAKVLEPLVDTGKLPPILLVGVHCSDRANGERRNEEYLYDCPSFADDPGDVPQRFASHERFFTEEVPAWAEKEFGASDQRSLRAVMGFSSGGSFAAEMGVRHPDLYGTVFSLASSEAETPQWKVPPPQFFMAVGTLDVFCGSTDALAKKLESAGANVALQHRVSGHDMTMWTEEIARTMQTSAIRAGMPGGILIL